MCDEPMRRVARVNKQELADMPAGWTQRERGQYLRLLLQLEGIDPGQIFQVEYYPRHRCWLVIQEGVPGRQLDAASACADDALFFLQTVTAFRRTALAAFARLAAHSSHFARFGNKYELPAEAEDLTPAALQDLLGNPGDVGTVRFDGEGRWSGNSSAN